VRAILIRPLSLGRFFANQFLDFAPQIEHRIQNFGQRRSRCRSVSQRAALAVAHVLLVPFVPRSFDVWTLEKVSHLVTEMRTANVELKAYTFINRADPRGQDNEDAAEVIRETEALTFIDTPLGTRKAFSNAAAQGLAVTELKPQDPKATEEMLIFFRYVFDIESISELPARRA